MVNSNGTFIPVVHIRIVCNEEVQKYSCDFCHRSFLSEKSLGVHIKKEHPDLHIQNIYVCSICKCCLLTLRDLEEHMSYRHQMTLQENSSEDCMICELCGVQLAEKYHLKEHMELCHALEYFQRGCSLLNFIELSLGEVWNMGMGDTNYKTLFKILELPVSESKIRTSFGSGFVCKRFNNSLNSVEKDSECIMKLTNVTNCENKNIDNIILINDEDRCIKRSQNPCQTDSRLDISDSDIISVIYIEDDEKSDLKALEHKLGKQVSRESKDQLILSVESEEKLVWSKDMVSKVLSSCKILKENKKNYKNSDIPVIVEKVSSSKNQEPQVCDQVNEDVLIDALNSRETIQFLPLTYSSQTDIVDVKETNDLTHSVHISKEIDEDLCKGTLSSFNTRQPASVEGSIEKHDKEGNIEEILIEVFNDDSRATVLELSGVDDGNNAIYESSRNCNESEQQIIVVHEQDTDYRKAKGKRKTCCACDMIFSNFQLLEKHESEAHGIRTNCGLCNDTFTHSKSLHMHYLRKHVDSGSFQCEICKKIFKSRGNLWSHRQTHTSYEAKRFECPKCPLRYHSRSKLNNHLQSHSGNKKYQCGECKRGFLYPSGLLKHMEKHFNEAHKELTENESLYLVEVEVQDSDKTASSSLSRDENPQPVLPSTSNS